MKRRAELLRVQTNVPCGTPLTAPHVTTGGLCRWKAINKEGRHVGLDFYNLLIEGDYTNYLPPTNEMAKHVINAVTRLSGYETAG